MPNDPAKGNNFIVERLAAFIIRDCGTGAGGFKAGNACAKGGGEGGNGEISVTEEKLDQSIGNQIADKNWAKAGLLTNEIIQNSCPENYPCDSTMNDQEQASFSNDDKENLFFYSDQGDTPLLTSHIQKFDDNFIYDETTLEFLREKGYVDEDTYPDNRPITQDDFEIVNSALQSVHEEIAITASKTDLDTGGNSLFRGTHIANDQAESFFNDLKTGSDFNTETISSWSKNSEVASGFLPKGGDLAKNVPVLLVGDNFSKGIDMDQNDLSLHGGEHEVLTPPAKFKVNKVHAMRGAKNELLGIRVHVSMK